MNNRIRQIIKIQLRQMKADPGEMLVIREEGKPRRVVFLSKNELEEYLSQEERSWKSLRPFA